jgi:two-component system alkaline phosphatase synthesis response regulator PhoP
LRILLIESDLDLIARLSSLLAAENFEVERAVDDESGLAKASSGDFDLIIMGPMPRVCDELRRKGIDTSILMLTEERVAALRLGADDCVSRSCDSNELLARVEALLRRVPRARRNPVNALRFGDIHIDFASAEAMKGGRPVSLSSKELRLLQYLAGHKERVVSRQEILRNVWEYDAAVSSRTVDVHIGWLRQKLEDTPRQPKFIRTIRGRGYRFDYDSPSTKSNVPSVILTLVSLRQRS